MATFEEKAKAIVTTAAQIARAQDNEPIATILETASPSLIQSGSDSAGPTIIYTLMLEVPVHTYAEIEGNREGLEHAIRDRIRPILRPYSESWIDEVIISPKIAEESRPVAPAPEFGATPEEAPSFWQPGFFRLFITHTSLNKSSAHNLKTALGKYHVAAFVAHDDIEPTREWQLEIERALRTMDALAAITTSDFVQSRWCDQEVGFAFGRGKLVLPLCKDSTPHGFLGKYQGFKTKDLTAPEVAEEVFEILLKHPLSAERITDALVERMATSRSFETSRDAMKLLERLTHLNESQVARLVQSIEANNQVGNAMRVPDRIRDLVSRIG